MPKNISVEGDLSAGGGAPFDTGLSTTVFAGGKAVALKDQTSSSIPDYYGEGVGGLSTASEGSPNVFAQGVAVHRVGDARLSGTTTLGPGIATVIVN